MRANEGKKLTPEAAAKRDEEAILHELVDKRGHSSDVAKLVALHPFAGAHVQHWRLRNGMNVLLAPDSASLVVAYHTWLSAGSRDEVAGRGGVAHLLEHLMFKGTHLHPPGSFDRLLERFGASPNAATWFDFTMFHQAVPPEAVAEVAGLEADRLTGLRIEPVGLRAEIEVVANERREHVDNDPDGALEEVFYRLAFPHHPYGRPVLGSGREIQQLTRLDVERFYDRHYHPSNATVVLVGAVEPVESIVAVVDAYESVTVTVQPARQNRPELISPHIDTPLAATVVIDSHADRFLAGWLAVDGDDPAHPLLTLAAHVLIGGASTRLHRALVEKGLAADVSVELPSLATRALFELRVEAAPGVDASAVRDAAMRTLRKLRTSKPVTERELSAAKNRLRRERYSELATIDGRAEALGHAMACFGDPTLPQKWWDGVQNATAQSVQAALVALLSSSETVELSGRASGGAGQ